MPAVWHYAARLAAQFDMPIGLLLVARRTRPRETLQYIDIADIEDPEVAAFAKGLSTFCWAAMVSTRSLRSKGVGGPRCARNVSILHRPDRPGCGS